MCIHSTSMLGGEGWGRGVNQFLLVPLFPAMLSACFDGCQQVPVSPLFPPVFNEELGL